MATNLFRPVVAPNLPVATPQYSAQYEDQYSNVLRLYFNQLDNFTRSLTNNGGGSLISFPYFSNSTFSIIIFIIINKYIQKIE